MQKSYCRTHKLVTIFSFSLITYSMGAEIDEYAPLTVQELKLSRLFSAELKKRGYANIPMSKKLTAVSRWNVWDLQQSYPFNPPCGLYSWSNKKPEKWKAFCNKKGADWSYWYNKPREITDYLPSVAYNSVSTYAYSPTEAIASIINSRPIWEKISSGKVKAYGLSIKGGFFSMWLGKGEDSDGYHDILSDRLTNVSGNWYDPNKIGAGFNFITLANGKTITSYYGKRQNGEGLWLISAPMQLSPNKTSTATMYEANQGTFALPKSNTTIWGNIYINLANCQAGNITLDGKDGTAEFPHLQLLVRPDDVECL